MKPLSCNGSRVDYREESRTGYPRCSQRIMKNRIPRVCTLRQRLRKMMLKGRRRDPELYLVMARIRDLRQRDPATAKKRPPSRVIPSIATYKKKKICETCQHMHPRKCKWKTGACFRYGKLGHRIRKCLMMA
jgi:hypothetical protein